MLETLHSFRRWETRKEYDSLHIMPAPPYNPARDPQYWEDPLAKGRTMVYSVLAMSGSNPTRDEHGNPFIEQTVMRSDDAAHVNFPPDWGERPLEVPVPLRPLESYEVLEFSPVLGGGVIVRDTRIPLVADTPTAFTVADRTLLQAIARKLGV